jgi:hypothetical protein
VSVSWSQIVSRNEIKQTRRQRRGAIKMAMEVAGRKMADKNWAYFTVMKCEQKSISEYSEGLTDGSRVVGSPATPLSIQ